MCKNCETIYIIKNLKVKKTLRMCFIGRRAVGIIYDC